jgi:hypothetical protein
MQWVVVMYSIWFVISPSLQTMLFLVKLDQRFKSYLTVFRKCPHVPTEYPSICPSVWNVQASSICTSKLNILVVNCSWPSWKETFSWDKEGMRVYPSPSLGSHNLVCHQNSQFSCDDFLKVLLSSLQERLLVEQVTFLIFEALNSLITYSCMLNILCPFNAGRKLWCWLRL